MFYQIPFEKFTKHIAPVLQPELQKGWNETTPEILMIVLCIERMYKVIISVLYLIIV